MLFSFPSHATSFSHTVNVSSPQPLPLSTLLTRRASTHMHSTTASWFWAPPTSLGSWRMTYAGSSPTTSTSSCLAKKRERSCFVCSCRRCRTRLLMTTSSASLPRVKGEYACVCVCVCVCVCARARAFLHPPTLPLGIRLPRPSI